MDKTETSGYADRNARGAFQRSGPSGSEPVMDDFAGGSHEGIEHVRLIDFHKVID